jgi:hypothetical protein
MTEPYAVSVRLKDEGSLGWARAGRHRSRTVGSGVHADADDVGDTM